MRKRVPADFGCEVLQRLRQNGMTRGELIQQISAATGLYVDSSYLYKILTGQRIGARIVRAVRLILHLPEKEALGVYTDISAYGADGRAHRKHTDRVHERGRER